MNTIFKHYYLQNVFIANVLIPSNSVSQVFPLRIPKATGRHLGTLTTKVQLPQSVAKCGHVGPLAWCHDQLAYL